MVSHLSDRRTAARPRLQAAGRPHPPRLRVPSAWRRRFPWVPAASRRTGHAGARLGCGSCL